MSFRWALLTPWKPFQILWYDEVPLLFRTRERARKWANEHYGYVKLRSDLRKEPHKWRMPRPVYVAVKMEIL